jgi:hypothetical protein
MKRAEFVKAVKLARQPDFKCGDFFNPVFSGCALDTKRRTVTLHEVATLLVEHCHTFGGQWLSEEQDKIEQLSKRFDLVG